MRTRSDVSGRGAHVGGSARDGGTDRAPVACGLTLLARRLGATMARTALLPKAIGLGTWGLVTLPIWGAFVAPWTLAWLVLVFNAYWLVRSSMLGIGAVVSFTRL